MGEVIDFVLEAIGDIIDFFESRKKRKTREKEKIAETDVPRKIGTGNNVDRR